MSLLSSQGIVRSYVKTAGLSEYDIKSLLPFAGGEIASMATGVPLIGPTAAALSAPEGRGMSRLLHSLGYGTAGSLAASVLGTRLGLNPKQARYLSNLAGLGAGGYGIMESADSDTISDRVLRALGVI
jgi:hypothetical protein